jgi:hypothetical protein
VWIFRRKSASRRLRCGYNNNIFHALCGRDEVQVSSAEFRRDPGRALCPQLSRIPPPPSRVGRGRELIHKAHDHDTRFARAVRRAQCQLLFFRRAGLPQSDNVPFTYQRRSAAESPELQAFFTDFCRALPFVSHATERLRRDTSDSHSPQPTWLQPRERLVESASCQSSNWPS